MKKPYRPRALSPESQAEVDRFYSNLGVESELVLEPTGFIVHWYQYGQPISGPHSFDYTKASKLEVQS